MKTEDPSDDYSALGSTGSRIFGSGLDPDPDQILRCRIQPDPDPSSVITGFTKLTRKFLATPASSVYLERLLSEYGNISEASEATANNRRKSSAVSSSQFEAFGLRLLTCCPKLQIVMDFH